VPLTCTDDALAATTDGDGRSPAASQARIAGAVVV
jgi:hypothetical protein